MPPTHKNHIDSITSPCQHSQLQTAAYLIGTHKELPDINEEEINCTCAIQLWYKSKAVEGQLTNQEPDKKGNSDNCSRQQL
jgi:hypothetical protein